MKNFFLKNVRLLIIFFPYCSFCINYWSLCKRIVSLPSSLKGEIHSAADIFCGDLPHKNRFIDFEILRCFILQAVRCTMSLFKQYRAIYVDSDIDLFMQCINSTNYYGCINCNLWLLNNVTTICTPLKYYYITGSKQLPLFHKPLHCRPQFLWV